MRIESSGDGPVYITESSDSPELREIVSSILPEWTLLFASKNSDYGSYGDSAGVLGIRGQYADIWRKMSKLKRSLWDGEELKFEGADEVIRDLIGHLFLTLYMMRVRDETDRAHAFSDMDTDQFVDRFIAEVGGLESARRLAGALSERLSARVLARCQQMADERPPRAGEPLTAKRLKHVEVAGKDVTNAISNVEFMQSDAEQNGVGFEAKIEEFSGDAIPPILKAGDIVRIQFSTGDLDSREFVVDDVSGTGSKDQLQVSVGSHEEDDGCDEGGPSPEDIERSMAEAQTGSSSRFQQFVNDKAAEYNEFGQYEYEEPKPKDPPLRVVTEQDGSITRYYHQSYPGADKEPLALIPRRLIEQMMDDKATEGSRMMELAEWGFNK